MHYYQFNIGNYRRKAHYLSILEHGIYRLLLDTYYLEEKPLCSDDAKLMRTHSIRTADEVKAFEVVINDFFYLADDGYRHDTCDVEIQKYNDKSSKASASAKARWDKNAKLMRTHSEGNANHKPITISHKPVSKKLTKKFKPPTLPDVEVYAESRHCKNLAKDFYDYFDAGDWHDSYGKKIKSWKQKFITWQKRNTKNEANKPTTPKRSNTTNLLVSYKERIQASTTGGNT